MKYKPMQILGYLAVVAAFAIASLANAEATKSSEHESKGYRFDRFINYYMMDYLDGDQAHTLGLETLAEFELGNFEVDHRPYLEVADYPIEIEGKPGNPFPEIGEATGISDLLTGFWASPKSHHGSWKFGAARSFSCPPPLTTVWALVNGQQAPVSKLRSRKGDCPSARWASSCGLSLETPIVTALTRSCLSRSSSTRRAKSGGSSRCRTESRTTGINPPASGSFYRSAAVYNTTSA